MRITKKFFNESEQRNVMLDKHYYTENQLIDLVSMELISDPGHTGWHDMLEENWVVYLRNVDKIEVELDEFGHLCTVAYMKGTLNEDYMKLHVIV